MATVTRPSVPSYWSDQSDQQPSSDHWLLPSSSFSSVTRRKQVSSKASSAGIFHTLFTKLRDWVSSPRTVSPDSLRFECRSSESSTECGYNLHPTFDAGVKGRSPLQSIVPTCCDVAITDAECRVDSLSAVTMAAGLPLSLSCGHVHRVHDNAAIVNCVFNDQQSSHDQLFYATWPLWSSKYCARGRCHLRGLVDNNNSPWKLGKLFKSRSWNHITYIVLSGQPINSKAVLVYPRNLI